MSGSQSDLIGGTGGKPKRITVLTSGTGTYIPTADNARCFIRRLGAGGGGTGANSGGTGGGAGALVETMELVPITGIDYVIGAKGVGVVTAAGTDGGSTRVGSVIASGGKGGSGAAADGGYLMSGDTTTGKFGLAPGVAGGAGGAGGQGGMSAGFSKHASPSNGTSSGSASSGGGGDSAFGKGGNGTSGVAAVGQNASGFGAGGGAAAGTGATKGGDGGGGKLEIWDYGV